MFKKSLLGVVFTAPVAFAEESTKQVDEVMVVTASRYEQPITEVLAPVSVLTSVDIDRLHIQDMSEILSRLTGLESQTSGGRGTNSSLHVRGGNTNHTLVLVDGVRINSASLGSTALQYINVNDIERVELVRGPGSSLYGADAVSGILQVITKKPKDQQLEVSFEVGSHEYQQTGVRFGDANEKTQWAASLSQESYAGLDRTINDSFLNGDDDAYRNSQATFSLTHLWLDNLISSVKYQIAKGEIESDNKCTDSSWVEVACRPYSEFRQEMISLENSWSPIENLEIVSLVSKAVDRSQNDDDAALPGQVEGSNNYFKTTRDTYALQGHHKITNDISFVLGVEYYNDKLKSSNAYPVTSRDNLAWFSNLNMSVGKHDFSLGARNDDNEAYGSHTTHSVAWGYGLTEKLRIITSWGTAFRAPTFNNLYWPEDPYGIGNPDLSPEESESSEVAVKYIGDVNQLSFSLFRNSIDGLIDWQPVIPGDIYGQYAPNNIDDARTKGFEIEYLATLGALSAAANYTWIDADNLNTNKRLRNRSRRMLNVDVDYTFEKWSHGVSLRARSDRFADAANSRQYPGYGVVDFRSRYSLSTKLTVSGSITNIFDKDYEAREGFNEPGRGFKLGVRYSM